MTMPRWQATVQTENGFAVVNPSVTVRHYPSLVLADIYDDDGDPKLNPFEGSVEGFVSFRAPAGRYLIEGVKGGQEAPDWIVDLAEVNVKFDTVALLLADTTLGYSAPSAVVLSVGDEFTAGGYRYFVAASGATDHHVTTAGGVKLYVRPGPTGAVNVAALGVDDTGATAVTTAVQSLIGFADEIVFPEGTYYCAINVTSPTTIRGAGEGRTIITTEALANGTTITVSANLNLRDLTVKGHPTSASSKTISHAGAHTVIASNVTFTGTNHDPAAGLSAAGDYRHCTFHSSAQPNALGARCFSALGIFTDCVFSGGRTVEARDSKFFSCRIGDLTTTNAVHVPDGATANDGNPNGYTGQCEFHDCIITAGGTGITEGNEGKAILRNCRIRCGLSVSGSAALYARSKSTFDAEGCDIFSGNNGTAVSFAKTVAQANGIGPSGESVLKRCRLEGALTSLAVPSIAAAYPAADGNARLVDCTIVGGDAEISPNNSTYHIFKTEQPLNYASTVIYASDGETKRFRFKQNKQLVAVYGSNAAKTGCFLSHLDEVTGLAHPDGMEIFVRYGGVSSRFVTFAQGATGDGGAMYFADAAATLATTQQGIYHFRLQGNVWRQCDG